MSNNLPPYLLPNMAVISRVTAGGLCYYDPLPLFEYSAAITAHRLPLPPGWMCTQYHADYPPDRAGAYVPGVNGVADLQRAALFYMLPTAEVRAAFRNIVELQPKGAASSSVVYLSINANDLTTLPMLDTLKAGRLIMPYNVISIGGSNRKRVAVNLTIVGFECGRVFKSIAWGGE